MKNLIYPLNIYRKCREWLARFVIFSLNRSATILRNNTRKNAFDLVSERAASSSADYIQSHLNKALLFPHRELLWNMALSRINEEGIMAEFGVFSGKSINYFAKKLPQNVTIFGFDSFEGLKEDFYGTDYAKGMFYLKGNLPKVLPNVTLIKGWFDVSLPAFLAEHKGIFSFIHMDADTFESTSAVLHLIKDRIAKDTIIIFDEYLGYPNWENGEFLAWKKFVASEMIHYRYIGFSRNQAAIQIL